MAGGERHRLADIAVRQRDARGGRGAERGRDTGDDFERDARFDQRLGFLAAAAEEAGVAPLQPADVQPLAGQADERFVDGFLGRGADAVAAFADVQNHGVGASFAEQFRGDQGVVQDGVRRLQAAQSAHGDEVRGTGTGAHEGHAAGLREVVKNQIGHRGDQRAWLRSFEAQCESNSLRDHQFGRTSEPACDGGAVEWDRHRTLFMPGGGASRNSLELMRLSRSVHIRSCGGCLASKQRLLETWAEGGISNANTQSNSERCRRKATPRKR